MQKSLTQHKLNTKFFHSRTYLQEQNQSVVNYKSSLETGEALCNTKRLNIVLREVDLGGIHNLFPCLQGRCRGEVSRKKLAFTLAEVLITIGIIGVVAAMTLPSLIQKYQEQATVARVKKFYSAFSQAYQMAVMDNGTIDTWGLPRSVRIVDENGDSVPTDETLESYEVFFDIMEPYLKKLTRISIKPGNSETEKDGFTFPDGTRIIGLWFRPDLCKDSNSEDAYCGDFYFFESKKKYAPFCFKFNKHKIVPYGTTDLEFKECLNGSNRSRCTAWVIYNGNMDYLHCDDLSWSGKRKCN